VCFGTESGPPKVVGHHTDMTQKTGTNEGCRSAPHRLGRFVSESARCRLSQWGPGSVLKHKGPAVPVPMELVLLSEGELPNWTGEVSISVALLRGPRVRISFPPAGSPLRTCWTSAESSRAESRSRPSKMASIRRLGRGLPGRSLHRQRNPRCASKRPLDVPEGRDCGTCFGRPCCTGQQPRGVSPSQRFSCAANVLRPPKPSIRFSEVTSRQRN
jgi:hypothetical protein